MRARYHTLGTVLLPLLASALLSLALLGVGRKEAARSRTASGKPAEILGTAFFDQLWPGAVAPNNLLLDRNGKQYRLDAFRGRRVTMVVFDTCSRCLRSIALWERIQRREPERLILGVSPLGPQTVLHFPKAGAVTLPLLFDPDYMLSHTERLPKCGTQVNIAPDGTVIAGD